MKRKFLAIILLCSITIVKADNPSMNLQVKDEAKKTEIKDGAPLKLKVFEGRRVVTETAEGKDIEAKLMQVRNKLDKEIKALDQEIEKDMTDWQGKARLKVDQELLERKQAEIMRKKKERDVKAEAAQEEFTRAVNRKLAEFNGKIKETVTQVAEKENWDLVQIKETGEIVYASKRVDATDKIIREQDNKFKTKKAEDEKAKLAVTKS